MIGDDELAVLVRALTFQLIDPTSGAVAGELISGTDAAMFPAPYPATFNGLEMYHRDVATTDSSLRWTHDGTGAERVQLTGPASAGALTANRPRTILTRDVAGNTTAQLLAGAGAGAGAGLGSSAGLTLVSLAAGAGYGADLQSGGNSLTLADPAVGSNSLVLNQDLTIFSASLLRYGIGAGRGIIYGVQQLVQSLGALTNITLAGVVLITVNVPAMPVAGLLVVDATIRNANVVAPETVTWQVFIDGVGQFPRQTCSAVAATVGQYAPASIHGVYGASAAAHTVTLVGTTAIANNSWQAYASDTQLAVAVYG